MATSSAGNALLPSRRVTHLLVLAASASLLGIALTDGSATAATYTVTTTADGGPGSLRDAIDQANANPGADTISIPAGTYTIGLAGAGEESNATGDFDITDDLTIQGAGAGATIIDTDGLDRAFDVQDGTTILQDLTIANGVALGGSGGNVLARPGANLTVQDSIVRNGTALNGGGLAADSGALTVLRSEIINNTGIAIQGNGSTGDALSLTGGAVSTLTITDSLIFGNFSVGGNVGAVYTNGNATITNTTITGNSAYARTLAFEASGPNSIAVLLVHVTLAGNASTGNSSPGGLYANASAPATLSVTLEGSLLMDNDVQGSGSNCGTAGTGIASITSNGRNLTDDLTCTGLVTPTDLSNNQGTSLGALADNGGPTRTLALLAGSSAIDTAGNCGAATAADQRGVTRPQGPACDIGAFEVAVVVPPSTDSSTTSTTTTTTAPTTTSTTPATVAPTTPTTSVGAGGVGATTLPLPPTTLAHGTLPATGNRGGNGLWLATLACSLGALLVLATRRRLTT